MNQDNDVQEMVAILTEARDEIDDFLKQFSNKSASFLESDDEINKLFGLGSKICKAKCHTIYVAEKGACGPGEDPVVRKCRENAKRHLNTCKRGC